LTTNSEHRLEARESTVSKTDRQQSLPWEDRIQVVEAGQKSDAFLKALFVSAEGNSAVG
jgi:hypothetical protein